MSEPPELFADVAVPRPLPPLTYSLPAKLAPLAAVGSRVRVPVGRRRLIGVVVSLHGKAPDGVALRPVEAVLDQVPALDGELMELARFTADYYLAPLGEVLRAMVPAHLAPWGDRRIWLTDRGALATPRDGTEAAVISFLRERGRAKLSTLEAELGAGASRFALEAALGEMTGRGWLASGERSRRGVRYVQAVELAGADVDELRAMAGRSLPGRRIVDYLAELGRPETVEELTTAAACGPGVVRRLLRLGVLRQFSQVESLALDHHLLSSAPPAPLRLRRAQREALTTVEGALARGSYSAFLLAGMTGSGKTEVYLRAIDAALREGRTALVLVPEISLVPALARSLRQRFGERTAILHSTLGRAERHQEWERIRSGEATVVLGARSAIFSPLERLGVIVVDEEQDGSFKQDSTPRYNARDLALVRARQADAVAILVSATPSLETRSNVERGKVTELRLTERIGQGELPEGVLVDLREEAPARRGEVRFSARLRQEIEETLERGQQVILLRNRRGYAPLLLCRACGEDFRCNECGLPRTLHKRSGQLLCHYCGSRRPVPERCPACGGETLEAIGSGTERVEERFAELFPGVPVEVLDRDAVRGGGGAAALLERFASGASRVLVGTQMVSKGHHFPRVALTAVLSADSYLGFPDFRAVERTYTLLTQLAGRAGRGSEPG
ncbi:MAG TPA: primosomal protein N', partial [Thermoanaerobaculia bacterium]|nr:primosomal protein N' [Thermoanaerobaculia bacterium]